MFPLTHIINLLMREHRFFPLPCEALEERQKAVAPLLWELLFISLLYLLSCLLYFATTLISDRCVFFPTVSQLADIWPLGKAWTTHSLRRGCGSQYALPSLFFFLSTLSIYLGLQWKQLANPIRSLDYPRGHEALDRPNVST